MGLFDGIKKAVGVDDDYENDDIQGSFESSNYNDEFNSAPRSAKSSKILTIPATTQLQVIVRKPQKYSDAAEIAEHFKNKRTVVLNLDNTNKDIANRLIDFLGGAAYVAGGELKRIANTTYIMVPYNVDITGDVIDELGSSSSDIFD